MPKLLIFLCVLLLGFRTAAFAQEAPVTVCDRYAASDLDPQRKATGVPFADVNPILAVPACEEAVRQYPNSIRLPYQLGRAYQKANNFTGALQQYRKAADRSFALALTNLGSMYASGLGVPQDYQQAIVFYRKAAQQGNALAQHNLGVMYANGQGVKQDYAEAVKWFRKAAEQNYVQAQAALGGIYAAGHGAPPNFAEAVKWYRKAADQGLGTAQNNLGVMYAKGQGVVQDYAEAVKWYRKAAKQGYDFAQANLGAMYRDGQGVPQNFAEAVKWFREAAKQGNVIGQHGLGALYYSGKGVQTNHAEAMHWFRKAADQGSVEDQEIIGGMYANGQGVKQDYAEAVKWFRKAAEQGNAEAKSDLGKLYAQFPSLRRLEPTQIAGEPKIAASVVALPTMPENEKFFIATVEKARAAYAAGANEMAQGAARPGRAKEICGVLKDTRVNKWIGEVETLSSNSDGLGVLSIQIAEGISIMTWNNTLSDADYRTLISPGSELFKQAVKLAKGQRVTFSGQFFSDSTDCIKESSLTLGGSLTHPEFIFQFSDLEAVETETLPTAQLPAHTASEVFNASPHPPSPKYLWGCL